MGQVLHGSAATTHAVRAAIQRSKASIQELSECYGINPKTVPKWRNRGWKLYGWHAPEVECIGKAKAPYEFGCKVSVTTPVTKPKGGSSCSTPRPCTAIPTMAIRSAR